MGRVVSFVSSFNPRGRRSVTSLNSVEPRGQPCRCMSPKTRFCIMAIKKPHFRFTQIIFHYYIFRFIFDVSVVCSTAKPKLLLPFETYPLGMYSGGAGNRGCIFTRHVTLVPRRVFVGVGTQQPRSGMPR